jgi:hypothetical protein
MKRLNSTTPVPSGKFFLHPKSLRPRPLGWLCFPSQILLGEILLGSGGWTQC